VRPQFGTALLESRKSLVPVGIRSPERPARSLVAITYTISRPPESNDVAIRVIVHLGDGLQMPCSKLD
jgi:hypothetical protein